MRYIRLCLVCLAFLLTLFLTFSGCSFFNKQEPQSLTVHFIDVGQGDSILIDMGKTEILIDGGDRSPGVFSYLDDYIDGPLEVMVATHTDADHIGGLIQVLAQFDVAEIWVNGYTASSKTFDDFMAAVNSEDAVVHEAKLGDIIRAGTLEFNVLNPPATLFSDPNNNSIVLTLDFRGTVFLFSGDAEIKAEEALLGQSVVSIPDIDILKVGHHASRTASSAGYLAVLKPEIAVYMCASVNQYGHPHQETIEALHAAGAVLYGTEKYGTIKITVNGDGYIIQTGKTPAY
jgi:competence protein ComEC